MICIFCITLHKALTSLRACEIKLIRAAPCPGIQTLHLGGGEGLCLSSLLLTGAQLWGLVRFLQGKKKELKILLSWSQAGF